MSRSLVKSSRSHTENKNAVYFLKTYQTITGRGCLVFTLSRHDPTFLIWNNLCDLVYQPPTKTYRSQNAVVVGTRTPPVEAALVVTYLLFPIQVCCPFTASPVHAHFDHAHFRHSLTDNLVVFIIVVDTRSRDYQTPTRHALLGPG